MMYDLIIIGATFLGLGAAYSAAGNILVLEKSQRIGYEYIDSYNAGTDWNKTALSAFGQKIKNELISRNILLENGKITIPAVAPLLYSMVLKDSLPILLDTDILEISKKGSAYEITVINASGIRKITAKAILDTTSGTALINRPVITEKWINAIIVCNKPDENVIETKNEKILSLKLEPDAGWADARKALFDYVKNNEDIFILSVAGSFWLKLDTEYKLISENYHLMPSYGYRNPLEAFETGVGFTGGVS